MGCARLSAVAMQPRKPNAKPKCKVCSEPMVLRRVFQRTGTLPEVRAYECMFCGSTCLLDQEAGMAVSSVEETRERPAR